MFVEALKQVQRYTAPVIVTWRLLNGKVHAGVGTCIIVNADGWVLTAAHVVAPLADLQRDRPAVEAHRAALSEIEADARLDDKRKRRERQRVHSKSTPTWVTDAMLTFAMPGKELHETPQRDSIHTVPEIDLALSRLPGFEPLPDAVYPIFRQPVGEMYGRTLCRLGFPFHEISAVYDESAGTFRIDVGTWPPAFFPIDGLYTRDAVMGTTADGRYERVFIEITTPGLRGQSGGPVFDSRGHVWGVQSQTIHLDLGFTAAVRRDGLEVEEHQFLNVGRAVHGDTVTRYLRDMGVAFATADG